MNGRDASTETKSTGVVLQLLNSGDKEREVKMRELASKYEKCCQAYDKEHMWKDDYDVKAQDNVFYPTTADIVTPHAFPYISIKVNFKLSEVDLEIAKAVQSEFVDEIMKDYKVLNSINEVSEYDYRFKFYNVCRVKYHNLLMEVVSLAINQEHIKLSLIKQELSFKALKNRVSAGAGAGPAPAPEPVAYPTVADMRAQYYAENPEELVALDRRESHLGSGPGTGR